MTSPLELRLQGLMRTEVDQAVRAQLYAQLGCYLARVGDFERAEKIRSEIRSSFGDGRSARVSILLMLMEGLLNLFQSEGADPRDRIVRAHLLSASFRERALVALTSAWLAHIDFNKSNFDLMLREIDDCLQNVSFDDGSALCRISLVLGDVFLVCGDSIASQAWYERARRAATAVGDQATIGAITYNRAAINVQNLRLAELSGIVGSKSLSQAEAEVNTAINYQALAQLQSLDYLLLAARVGIKMAKCEFSDAEAETRELLKLNIVPSGCSEHLVLLADLSFITAISERIDESKELRRFVQERIDSDLDHDDKALIYFLLSKTAKICEASEVSEAERKYAIAEFELHKLQMKDVRSRLEKYVDPELVLSL